VRLQRSFSALPVDWRSNHLIAIDDVKRFLNLGRSPVYNFRGMAPSSSEPLDPTIREVRKRHVLERFEHAEDLWAAAIRAHKLAPPDRSFAGRLRTLAKACAVEAAVAREAAEVGLQRSPLPRPPTARRAHELQPGTARRGPDDLWQRFDLAVERFNRAVAGADPAAVADGYAALGDAALALAVRPRRP
jgi:hypothetical protein